MDQKLKKLLENVRNLIDDLLLEPDEPVIELPMKIQDELEDLLSIKQIIKQYYITEPTLKKYRDQNFIKPVNQNRRPFFRRKDVLQMMQILKPSKYPDSRNIR